MSPAASAEEELEVEVTALGAAGDGLAADGRAGRLHVPGALPGERWRVRPGARVADGRRAAPLARLGAAAPRATPVCPHFGPCGGCRLQHLPAPLYAAFKRRRIVDALARRGLPGEAVVGAPALAPLGERRRLRLGVARARNGELRLGLRERGSHRLEPIAVCPIAAPALVDLLPALAPALRGALASPWPAELGLTLTETGVDLLVRADRAPSAAERRSLPALAEALDLARVAWGDGGAAEPLAVRRAPTVRPAGVPVALPPGAFLQATAFGEARLAAAVGEWGAGCRHAVDLFAGAGTLTFPLARAARTVRAFERDPAAAAALARAAARAGLGHVAAAARDLDRRPLAGAELAGCDLAVLDPPRAGAPAQAAALARSAVPRVVHASCHPESFARDARTLVDGGFALVEVRPIDQFRYAAEVELVALFRRPPVRRRNRA